MTDASPRLVARAAAAAREPLAWILAGAAVLRLVGLGWGLPSSDAWDNDGIAPRDFLPGLVETFTPGHYFTYPPAHLALLALVTAPVTIVLLARAPSLAPASVVGEALAVPYMTSYAVIARVVSAAMSLGVIWAMAKLAEEVAGRRAGTLAALVCALGVSLTYYGHTTNLDVPYVFWASLALLSLARAVARAEPRRLRSFGALAALSVASKDQAYALFVLGAPLALASWTLLDPWPRRSARQLVREALVAVAVGAAILLVLDGAVTNPSGFRARLAFLAGPASQAFAYYSPDALGRALVAWDSVARFGQHYPLAFAPLVAAGLLRVARGLQGRRRAAGLVPLFAALSFTLLFNCVARRAEHRFVMPQMVLWSVYAGLGLDALLDVRPQAARWGVRVAAAAAFAWALFRCADVDANLVLDPRYDVEAWLDAHTAPGDTIEVEGETVYLPRLPARARVLHVGPEPTSRRNPVYRAEEIQAPLGDVASRAPRFIVVSLGYAGHFLGEIPPDSPTSGRIRSVTQRESAESDKASFFRALFAGALGYRVAHVSKFTSRIWPRVDIHGSTGQDIFVFERTP